MFLTTWRLITLILVALFMGLEFCHTLELWTLIGTICLLLAFPVVFFLFIEPVNIVIEQAIPQSLPPNWMQLRNQWEYAHATNFILSLAGFSALLISVLVETPSKRSRNYKI